MPATIAQFDLRRSLDASKTCAARGEAARTDEWIRDNTECSAMPAGVDHNNDGVR
jgi:hypothetical protein